MASSNEFIWAKPRTGICATDCEESCQNCRLGRLHAAIEEPTALGDPARRALELLHEVPGVDIEGLVVLSGQAGLLKSLHVCEQARLSHPLAVGT